MIIADFPVNYKGETRERSEKEPPHSEIKCLDGGCNYGKNIV